MSHKLDNPIWEALLTGNSHFASGNERVKYYPVAVATFAGFHDFSDEEFRMLYEMMPAGSVRATFIPFHRKVPDPWISLPGLEIYQMIDTGQVTDIVEDIDIVPLTNSNIPAMTELTTLSRPGPFNERTIEFGNFFGFLSDNKLVAMAGQRLQVDDYVEISAVCTHPHYQGRGYAKRLLLHQINIIRRSGHKPMLHVKTDNQSAIRLYESVGFRIRRILEVLIFKKK